LYGKRVLRKQVTLEFDVQSLALALKASLAMSGIIVGLQLFYYNIYIIPFYLAVGIMGFLFVFCRGLKEDDVRLIHDLMPSFMRKSLNVLRFFGAPNLSVKIALT
jgi:hypothetical protein